MNSRNIPIGKAEIQVNKFLSIGALKKLNADILYYPLDNAVCIRYRHQLNTYHLFLSQFGRQSFIDGLNNYKESYEARELDTQNRKTIRSFGVVQGYLYWQMSNFTVQSKSSVNVSIGYQFKDNSPFFTIRQERAEDKSNVTDEENRISTVVTMFFTRAQAAELAVLLEQDFLNSIAMPPSAAKKEQQPPPPPVDPDRDEY